ncbi:endonuclease/exonuclease/phosphatase family protein [Psychromonas sp.]|uniref:endonuclease/exonuclease/phosphatase family protein n=1 Tax=Psychromonas sp. TaxID=1884585 RepID=UPI00356862C1
MKDNLTFLPTGAVAKVYLPILLVLLGIIVIFPRSPQYLTVVDNNRDTYRQTCPELATITAHVPSEQKLPLPFTLLNWNIYKQKRQSWQEELQKLTLKSDLLTLQEIKYSPEFIDFSRLNRLFYLQNNAFKYQGDVYGVNTLSKVSASYVCGTRYSEPWVIIPKTGLATAYPIGKQGQSLLLINIHGVNFTFTATPLKEQMQPYLTLIESHSGPVIFSGDFNTWSSVRLEEVAQTFQQAGFQEALFENDQRTNIFGLPLDHIYYRGLQIIKSESWKTEASDHTPQRVTFTLKEEPH